MPRNISKNAQPWYWTNPITNHFEEFVPKAYRKQGYKSVVYRLDVENGMGIIPDNSYYIGKKTLEYGMATYLSSSENDLFVKYITLHPEKIKRTILFVFKDLEGSTLKEREILNERIPFGGFSSAKLERWKFDDCLNLCGGELPGTAGKKLTEEQKKHLSVVNSDRPFRIRFLGWDNWEEMNNISDLGRRLRFEEDVHPQLKPLVKESLWNIAKHIINGTPENLTTDNRLRYNFQGLCYLSDWDKPEWQEYIKENLETYKPLPEITGEPNGVVYLDMEGNLKSTVSMAEFERKFQHFSAHQMLKPDNFNLIQGKCLIFCRRRHYDDFIELFKKVKSGEFDVREEKKKLRRARVQETLNKS